MKWKVALIIVVAFFLYSYDLTGTTVFVNDIARDTIRSLEILKNKELTLIGPPASIGQYGTRNIFFGSFSLYMGALGLAIWDLQPVAAAYIGVLLFLLAVPFMYALLKDLSDSKKVSLIGTVLFAFSPLTVTHARFFWNANFLIPLSVFFWFFIRKKRYLLAGLTAGIMMNMHYITLLPVLFYVTYLLYKRSYKAMRCLVIGFIIASLPLIVFELRNEWYLTNALIHNLQNPSESSRQFLWLITRFSESTLAFLGLRPAEISYPTLVVLPPAIITALSITLLAICMFAWKHLYQKFGVFFVLLFMMNVVAIMLSHQAHFNIRYMFPIYPLVVWTTGEALSRLNKRILIQGVILFMFLTSGMILMQKPQLPETYISLAVIEDITDAIVNDSLDMRYNITENIKGDARAMPFRYFLLRDADKQPENFESYTHLSRLYVISPTEEKIYKESRWEFTATKNLDLIRREDFGEVSLFTFEATQ